MANTFQKAQKSKAKLRMAIAGPSGSGKTYSALAIATALGGDVLVADTEGGKGGSANKYADKFDFYHEPLLSFHPQLLIDLIDRAEKAGISTMIVDSFSHFWSGKGGVLDIADDAAKRMRGGNSFTAWKEATPIQRALIDRVLQSSINIICCMRSKMEYVLEAVEKNGRTYQTPKRVGMAPIQRDDVSYEFDLFIDMDKGTGIVTKSRCEALTDAVIKHPGAETAAAIKGWLSDGVDVPAPAPAEPPAEEPVQPPATDTTEPTKVPGWEDLVADAKKSAGDWAPGSGWGTDVAKKLGHARNALSDKLGAEVTTDVTRDFLRGNFDVQSHKDMTLPQQRALLQWLRECYEEGRLVS